MDLVYEVSKEKLKKLHDHYGIDASEGSSLLRLAVARLLSDPPIEENSQNLMISCKDDETFAKFLSNIVGEKIPA